MKEFGIRKGQIGSVSIISIAKAKLSSIVDTTESKFGSVYDALKLKLGVVEIAKSKLSHTVHTAESDLSMSLSGKSGIFITVSSVIETA